jgi:hypothetical protein
MVLAQRNRRELTATGAVVLVFLLYAVLIPDPWVRWGCLGVAFGVSWSGRPCGEPADRARWALILSRPWPGASKPFAPGLVLCLVGVAGRSGMPVLSAVAGLLVQGDRARAQGPHPGGAADRQGCD